MKGTGWRGVRMKVRMGMLWAYKPLGPVLSKWIDTDLLGLTVINIESFVKVSD